MSASDTLKNSRACELGRKLDLAKNAIAVHDVDATDLSDLLPGPNQAEASASALIAYDEFNFSQQPSLTP